MEGHQMIVREELRKADREMYWRWTYQHKWGKRSWQQEWSYPQQKWGWKNHIKGALWYFTRLKAHNIKCWKLIWTWNGLWQFPCQGMERRFALCCKLYYTTRKKELFKLLKLKKKHIILKAPNVFNYHELNKCLPYYFIILCPYTFIPDSESF